MDAFWKRVQAIKELYPSVTSNQGNISYDDDLNVVETNETDIANKITEMDTARNDEKTIIANARTSGKAKLKSGEALTDDEIKALFGD